MEIFAWHKSGKHRFVFTAGGYYGQKRASSAQSPLILSGQKLLEIAVLKLRLFLELNIANETKIFQSQKIFSEIRRC